MKSKQIVVFHTRTECNLTLLELESAINVGSPFADGRAIVVSSEDAMLLKLAYGNRIHITLEVGEFLKAHEDK